MIPSKVFRFVGITLLFLFFILSLTDAAAGPPQRSSFGEFCNETTKCQRGAWLSCDLKLEKCLCTKGDEMEFNKDKGKCVAFIGEACRFLISSDDGESRYQESDCVSGAHCNSSEGICTCLNGHYEDSALNICVPSKAFGESCGSAGECAYDKFMTCVGGTCQCENPETMLYDANVDTCRIRAGKACDPSGQATNQTAPCVATADCISDVCTCPAGTYGNRVEGFCSSVKQAMDNCSYDEECDPKQRLSCVNGSCECNPLISVENTNTFQAYISRPNYEYHHIVAVLPGLCLAKVGQPCRTLNDMHDYYTEDPSNIYCARNADCSNEVCACRSGYQRTNENMCGKGYGGDCSTIEPCTDNFRCVGYGISHPNNPTCQCPNRFYDMYEGNACVRLVGSPCLPEGSSKCAENSECVKYKGGRYICRCSKGYVMNGNKKCDIAFGYECNTNYGSVPYCDAAAKLECRMGGVSNKVRCSCANEDDVYEEKRRQCSRPLGVACMNSDECISNAICLKVHQDIDGECSCSEGYIISEDVSCIRPPSNVTNRLL